MTHVDTTPIDDDLHQDETNHKLFLSLLIACGVALVAIVVIVVALAAGGGSDGVTHRYVIPAGTSARIAAGEQVNVMPTKLVVHVGDTLILRNDDSVTQQMGPLSVNAGSVLKMKFARRGTIEGTCTMNAEGTAKIVIEE
jgi:hypothetical protein